MFSARRTVDLKARRVEVNQGLDLDLRLENLVITGACLSSRTDRWRAVGNRQRWSKRRVRRGQECDSGCELGNLHVELG